MSEAIGDTPLMTDAAAPKSDPNHQWYKVYDQACIVLASTNAKFEQKEKDGVDAKETEGDSFACSDEEMIKAHQRIMITLDMITKVIFGLSTTRKAQVVVHGGGAVELIVDLVRASRVLQDTSSTTLAKPILASALKAIKTAVIRNPAARCRCRSADVFSLFRDVLDVIFKKAEENKDAEDRYAEDKMLVEQVFTALAAICLGDDLNALQASTHFKTLIEKTKAVYCDEGDGHESSLDQKLEYLSKLFVAIYKEQSDLISYLEKSNPKDDNGKSTFEKFAQNIMEAEVNIRSGYMSLQRKKYKEAAEHYSSSLNLITPYNEHTKLLDPLVIEARTKRGQCNYEMDKVDSTLKDTTYLLEQERLGEAAPNVTVAVLKLHAIAMIKVGRSQEAEESLGKLSLLCPDDDEVIKMMKDLDLL